MRIVFFTGAGISQESGLQTFRDADGLWEGFAVEEVCSTTAWKMHPDRVLAFYNDRRRGVRAALPNAAHKAVAALEQTEHAVTIVTQNIDDLHERAGSKNIIHLHGEIMKSRSETDGETFYPCDGDIKMGDLSPNGKQLRPHVVFFGEAIYNQSAARAACKKADVLVIVGTSLAVYPAASLAESSNARTVYVVDPKRPAPASLSRLNRDGDRRVVLVQKTATEGIPEAIRLMTQ